MQWHEFFKSISLLSKHLTDNVIYTHQIVKKKHLILLPGLIGMVFQHLPLFEMFKILACLFFKLSKIAPEQNKKKIRNRKELLI